MRFSTLAAACAAVLIGAATAATAPTAAAEPYSSCRFHFMPAGEPYMHEPVSVITGGFADCRATDTPEQFMVLVTLHYRLNGQWVQRAAEQSDQIPNPRTNIATYARCEDGAWMGVADIWERLPGEPHETHNTWRTPPVIIDC
ncbi:hypothetical protein BJY24_004128 [Nocardia transvalensis]|uniref:Secreted protein n=1 Tax=Nocardia transvalensis TaxID=37333 RepID=A0A7W9PFW7_9NOCA|nr:hypothetical protein [Nocardia transvalensis]MBB5915261.1 hypothetical protein [Nocardia transvalensis]